MVTDDNRAEWEDYAEAEYESFWMPSYLREVQYKAAQDSKYPDHVRSPEDDTVGKLQAEILANALDTIPHKGFSKSLWGAQGDGEPEAPDTGPYLPMWQVSPALPLLQMINFNNRDISLFVGAYDEALMTGQATLTPLSHLDDPNDIHSEVKDLTDAVLSMGQYRHELEVYQGDPITFSAYPVFDSLDLETRSVVGILGCSFYWRILLFQDLLSPSGQGYIAVVKNNWAQEETFRVYGPDAEFRE